MKGWRLAGAIVAALVPARGGAMATPARPDGAVVILSGCPATVDRNDPLNVAGAATGWLYCGFGPPGILSAHARHVIDRLGTRLRSPVALASLSLVEPRATPVVVYAIVRRPADPVARGIAITLYWQPSSGWIVDDVAVFGG